MKIRQWIYLLISFPLLSFAQVPEVVVIPSADGTLIKAHLLHPAGMAVNQPRPVVVALHGCGGLYSTTGINLGKLNPRHSGMAQLIQANGYSIVFPDSFTARGETSLCSQKFNLRKINFYLGFLRNFTLSNVNSRYFFFFKTFSRKNCLL